MDSVKPWVLGFWVLFGVLGSVVSWVQWCPGFSGVLGSVVSWVQWCPGFSGVLGSVVSWVRWCPGFWWCPGFGGVLGSVVLFRKLTPRYQCNDRGSVCIQKMSFRKRKNAGLKYVHRCNKIFVGMYHSLQLDDLSHSHRTAWVSPFPTLVPIRSVIPSQKGCISSGCDFKHTRMHIDRKSSFIHKLAPKDSSRNFSCNTGSLPTCTLISKTDLSFLK